MEIPRLFSTEQVEKRVRTLPGVPEAPPHEGGGGRTPLDRGPSDADRALARYAHIPEITKATVYSGQLEGPPVLGHRRRESRSEGPQVPFVAGDRFDNLASRAVDSRREQDRGQIDPVPRDRQAEAELCRLRRLRFGREYLSSDPLRLLDAGPASHVASPEKGCKSYRISHCDRFPRDPLEHRPPGHARRIWHGGNPYDGDVPSISDLERPHVEALRVGCDAAGPVQQFRDVSWRDTVREPSSVQRPSTPS